MNAEKQRPVGFVVTSSYCWECAPEGLKDFYNPMLDGNGGDWGVRYDCDTCGEPMTPEKWEKDRKEAGY